YGGNDPATDSRGYTGPILTEYACLRSSGEDTAIIEISALWKGREVNKEISGIHEDVVRLPFRIPDLAISDDDMIITASGPENDENKKIAITVTNLGTQDASAPLTLYHVIGGWDIGTNKVVGDISLPRWAELIGEEAILVRGRDSCTVEFEWVPEEKGDHTFVALVDEEHGTLELRKDNNAASLQITLEEDEIPRPPMAEIWMDIPPSLNHSNLSSGSLNLSIDLSNTGELKGSVILRVTLYQGKETLFFCNKLLTVPAGENITVRLGITMEPGDALINITLLPGAGERALKILTPYLSLILHVRDDHGARHTGGNDEVVPRVVVYSTTAGAIAIFIAYMGIAESARYRFLMLFVPLYMR
ncbi:MAG: hypothetical protein KAU14_05180, partial [Thermoplasmata archaeon]|nr:hypothetical protein [Thermoplasmata archaeon]